MQTIFTDTLEQAFAQAGLDMPKINGSKIARFSTNGSKGDTAGWLRVFDDSTGAAFGDWRTGEAWCWQKKNDEPRTEHDLAALRAKAREQQRMAEIERQKEYEAAAAKAKEIIADCAPATAHPYLEDKHISASGALTFNGKLVIPVHGPNGIQSFQSIDANGGKKFMPGGKMSGGYFAIGEKTDTVVVCEGFATGASIHASTGLLTMVAFSASNLKAVATMVRDRQRSATIIIAGDNDESGTGQRYAAEAAEACNGRAVFPHSGDFNDMACSQGTEAVAKMFEQNKPPIGYDITSVTGEFTAPDYLIKGVMNRGDLSVTFGDSGSMKSFVELDKAMRLGMGWTWNGHKVKRAMTLIVLGEGAGGYRRRVRAWLQHHNLLNEKDQPWVWVIDKAAELYSNPKGMREWVEAVERHVGRKVDHVLIDTLNTNMGQGADENDAVAVGSMLAYSKESTCGAAVTFVHHVGHGDKGRERGSYAIRGNMDNRMLVERDEDGKGKVITVSSLKVKDGEEFKPVNMTYQVEILGTDSDGDDITSLVLVPTELEPAAKARETYKGKNQNLFQRALAATVEQTGNNSKEDVRRTFYMMHEGNDATKRQAFNRGWQEFMNNATNGGQ